MKLSKFWRTLATARYKTILRTIEPEFDRAWYLAQYPDVADNGMDPVEHYLFYGADEGRRPHANFDGKAYLDSNEDVREKGDNPFYHWIRYGRAEHRPTFTS